MNTSLSMTAGRAVAITGTSESAILAKVATRNAASIAAFEDQVTEATKQTFKNLLVDVANRETDLTNLGVMGLGLQYQAGLALAALKAKNNARTCPAKLKGDDKKAWTVENNWPAYCKGQRETDPGFPSYQQADKRIRLASLAAIMPETDEMGAAWTMRSFERYATQGTSLNGLQLAKLNKATRAAKRALPKGSEETPSVSPADIRATKLTEKEAARASGTPALARLPIVEGIDKCRDILMERCFYPEGVTERLVMSDDELATFDKFIASLVTVRDAVTNGKPQRKRAKASK